MPETWEGITFDEEGICNICRTYERKVQIDWAERQKDFKEVLDYYRQRAIASGNKYDVLIGLSGGKDSVYTLWAAKRKYDLRPLAVTFDHGIPMRAEAEYNLQTIPRVLDVDHVRFTIGNGLRNAMARHTSRVAGDWCYFCHFGVGAFPARISQMFDIPLQLWGEPTAEYQTTGSGYSFDDLEEQDAAHCIKAFRAGLTLEEALPDGYEMRDFQQYQWPMNPAGTLYQPKAVYLGNYEPWDQREHVDIIKRELGWKTIPSEITYVDWDKCDCKEGEELRDVQKFHRRRLSRVAFQASKDVRDGLITREQAMELVEKYEAQIPELDCSFVLGELGFESKEELLGMTKGVT